MFLKICFWVLTILYLLLIIGSSFEVAWALIDWISFILIALGFVALFGLAYNKTIWTRRIWIIITLAVITLWLLYTFYLDKQFGAYPPKTIGDFIATLIGGLPALIACLFYTKKLK